MFVEQKSISKKRIFEIFGTRGGGTLNFGMDVENGCVFENKYGPKKKELNLKYQNRPGATEGKKLEYRTFVAYEEN